MLINVNQCYFKWLINVNHPINGWQRGIMNQTGDVGWLMSHVSKTCSEKRCVWRICWMINQILIEQIFLICLGWLLLMTLVEDLWMGHRNFTTPEGWQPLFLGVSKLDKSSPANRCTTDAKNGRCSKLPQMKWGKFMKFLAVCISLGVQCTPHVVPREDGVQQQDQGRGDRAAWIQPCFSWFCFHDAGVLFLGSLFQLLFP